MKSHGQRPVKTLTPTTPPSGLEKIAADICRVTRAFIGRSLRYFPFMILVFFVSACQDNRNSTVPASATTTVDATTPAQAAVVAYFKAWRAGDIDTMVGMFSDYSIGILGATRADLRASIAKLDLQGVRILDYKLIDTKTVSDETQIIRVEDSVSTTEQKAHVVDTWFAVRNEHGSWKINASDANDQSLVDDLQLGVLPQTIDGVTVQPLRLERFVSYTKIIFSVDNQTPQTVNWGFGSDIRATLHLPDRTLLQATDPIQPILFAAETNYPDAVTTILGYLSSWPSSLQLSNWRWSSRQFASNPDPGTLPWSYSFSLVPEGTL